MTPGFGANSVGAVSESRYVGTEDYCINVCD
jgi:hypothetical protein